MNDDKLSRRSLLAKAAAAAVSTPTLAQAAMSALQSRPIVGQGEFRYECYHDWLTPPANVVFGYTHGLAVDSEGRIYLAQTVHPSSVGSDAVQVYDQKGKLVDSWGAEFRNGAHGLDLRKEGNEEFLYHCDINRRLVVKTDLKGKVIWQQGWPKDSGVYQSEDQWKPTNVAFHPEGDVYVGDGYGSSYVHRYSKDGAWKSVVAGPGKDPGKLNTPHGLWVDDRDHHPKLCVADRGNHRLQYFSLEGEYLSMVTDGMRQPCHIHYNKGWLLIPDLDSVVTILDKSNKVAAMLGDGAPTKLHDAPRDQFIPGKFINPHASIWINKNDILVAEWVSIGRVTLLKKVS